MPTAGEAGAQQSVGASLRGGSARRTPYGVRFLVDVMLGATLMALVHLFIVQISVVRGQSMRPALEDGDRLVVDRVCYQLTPVHRNDIVVLRCPYTPTIDFVKRVVGLPGDRIEMHHGRLYVNDTALEGEYVPIQDDAELVPLQVPEGHYFVLGDNRPVSCDSREFGLVAEELLRGRVRMRFWPPDRFAVF